jgi:hypothetical protein
MSAFELCCHSLEQSCFPRVDWPCEYLYHETSILSKVQKIAYNKTCVFCTTPEIKPPWKQQLQQGLACIRFL